MWDKLKKLFTRPRLILLGKVAVFVAGAIITYNFQFWFFLGAGGIFGLVVLIWYARSFKDFANWRCAVFLIASILIGAAVWVVAVREGIHNLTFDSWYRVPDGWVHDNKGWAVSVLAGTILLAVVHKLLLGASWRRVFIAIPCIYGAFILFFGLVHGFEEDWTNQAFIVEFEFSIFNHVATWQAAYLVSMFGFRKKEAGVTESSE